MIHPSSGPRAHRSADLTISGSVDHAFHRFFIHRSAALTYPSINQSIQPPVRCSARFIGRAIQSVLRSIDARMCIHVRMHVCVHGLTYSCTHACLHAQRVSLILAKPSTETPQGISREHQRQRHRRTGPSRAGSRSASRHPRAHSL